MPWGTIQTCSGGQVDDREQGLAAVLAGGHDQAGGLGRPGQHGPAEGPLGRAEVLGVQQRLEVVDGEQAGHGPHGREDAAGVVDHGHALAAALEGQPRALGRHPHRLVPPGEREGDGLEPLGQLGVGVDERAGGRRGRPRCRAGATSSTPSRVRTVYSSLPPTTPGTSHSRLTPTRCGVVMPSPRGTTSIIAAARSPSQVSSAARARPATRRRSASAGSSSDGGQGVGDGAARRGGRPRAPIAVDQLLGGRARPR